MMTKIYDLAYEINGDTINLEQDLGCGEVSRVDLHPIHLRLLAEEAGLLPSSNIEANRTIARLCRQMRVLFHRIDQLDDWVSEAAQRGHEDLAMETTYSFATWELANEFVTELPDTAVESDPMPAAAPCQSERQATPSNAASRQVTPQTALNLEGGE